MLSEYELDQLPLETLLSLKETVKIAIDRKIKNNNKSETQQRREKFLNSYSGRELTSKHSLYETGIWKIFGEDPNCDLTGHHHMPDLGTVEGRLTDVINEAVAMSGFWQWGAGGRIEKVSIRKIKKV